MRLVPHETDNWDEFDLRAVMKRHQREHDVSDTDLLLAIIEGLVNVHRMQRLDHPGEMPPTLLQGVELLLAQECNRNLQVYEE